MIDPEYFANKRYALGMDRQDTLSRVQMVLDEWYPGRARARRLHQRVLRVETASSSVAGELRLRQVELLARLEGVVEAGTRLSVVIAA